MLVVCLLFAAPVRAQDNPSDNADLKEFLKQVAEMQKKATGSQTQNVPAFDVDPPRVFSRNPAHPFWQDPWVREWEIFRRHLVNLHYDELSQWLVEVGVPRDRRFNISFTLAGIGTFSDIFGAFGGQQTR